MRVLTAWLDNDPICGEIDYVLYLDVDTGNYSLSMNGQGHLPISQENVCKILEDHPPEIDDK